jgi:hypothetical protein
MTSCPRAGRGGLFGRSQYLSCYIRGAAVLTMNLLLRRATRRYESALQKGGCRYGQVYLFSRPVRAEKVDWLLSRNRPLPFDVSTQG